MSNLIRNTNNLFDTVFGGDLFSDVFFDSPLVHRPYMARRQNGQVVNRDEDWQVVFAVPGVKPEDVKIKVDDNILNVSYSNSDVSNASSFVSSFSRSWTLDKDVNVDNIDATHENGVLTIVIPKPEGKKKVSRVIDVKTVKALTK
jgi:HSP20 family protein